MGIFVWIVLGLAAGPPASAHAARRYRSGPRAGPARPARGPEGERCVPAQASF